MSDAIQSLAEAIVLGISRELDIDVREVNAGFSFLRIYDEHFADIFVHDTLAGGAGYAIQAGESISRVIDLAEMLLKECECSSSCDKCLRHYGNRFYHAKLDRFLAIELLEYMRGGFLPSEPTIEAQRIALKPLIEILQLAGWKSDPSDDTPAVLTSRNGKAVKLYSYPSIVRLEHYKFTESADTFAFSLYELSRDLPGAFGRIQ